MPSLVAFIAHPDDESYSFGGLIALAARAGWRCHIECATYGERGERHDGGLASPDALAETRATELSTSCSLLAAQAPEFWGLPDGELRFHRGEQLRIAQVIRSLTPSLILSLGRDGAYGHPDHIALQRWVTETWAALEPPRPALLFAAFPRGLFLPQYEKCLPMMGEPPSPTAEEIGGDSCDYTLSTDSVAEIKRQAIGAHRSQLPGGRPEALFPSNIVASLLTEERYTDASGVHSKAVADVLASFR